jgi:hypothetical protein
MPHYFFHIRYVDGYIHDPDGTSMADDTQAVEFAKSAARELVASSLKRGATVRDGAMVVIAEDSRHVAAVPFRAAFRFEL